jgi:hypothetical protein
VPRNNAVAVLDEMLNELELATGQPDGDRNRHWIDVGHQVSEPYILASCARRARPNVEAFSTAVESRQSSAADAPTDHGK